MKKTGFVLIELIVIMSIISIFGAIGVSAYKDYAVTKRVSTAADEVANLMEVAKARAFSQVKPESCGVDLLEGYRVVTCPGGCSGTKQDYQLEVYCGGSGKRVGDVHKLSPNVRFSPQTEQTVLFRVLTGEVQSSGNIQVTSEGKAKSISVGQQGVIAMTGLEPITPVAASTPTPSVTPIPVPVSITSFAADKPILPQTNTGATLSWTVAGTVKRCTGSGDWSGDKDFPSGTYPTGSVSQKKTYTLTCFGTDGSSDPKTATVDIVVITSFSANPPTVSYNTSSQLNWQTSNATSCTGSGAWSGSKPTSGQNVSVGPLFDPKTYTLTCLGDGGAASNPTSVDVAVNDPTGTIWDTYSDPSTKTAESTATYKNTLIYNRTSTTKTIYQIGIYATGGSGGYSWWLYNSVSQGTYGTLVASGTLRSTPNAANYYVQSLAAPIALLANKYYIIRVNISTGTTVRRGSSATSDPIYFFKYSTGTANLTNSGAYALRLIYQ